MAIIPNVIQKVAVMHAHFLCRVNSSWRLPGAPGHSAESHRLRDKLRIDRPYFVNCRS
jgi:hypothetical protein